MILLIIHTECAMPVCKFSHLKCSNLPLIRIQVILPTLSISKDIFFSYYCLLVFFTILWQRLYHILYICRAQKFLILCWLLENQSRSLWYNGVYYLLFFHCSINKGAPLFFARFRTTAFRICALIVVFFNLQVHL